MKKYLLAPLALCVMSGAVLAQTASPTAPSISPSATTPAIPTPTAPSVAGNTAMTTPPAQSTTIGNWYKQNVYDNANASVGQVMDVLVDPQGKVSALIIGVGGFLGMGDHDVAVPFDAIKHTVRDGKAYLTIAMTKDQLKSAPGLRYDNATTTWVPDTK